MHYVVTGVGYTGRRVLAALPADRTLGLGRTLPAGTRLDDEAETRLLDLDRPGQPTPGGLLHGMAACTVLYTVPPRADSHDDERLARFLDLLGERPARIVYVSTSGVYGDRQGLLTDETVPPEPQTERARRRLAAETRLGQWCEINGVERTVLRVPGIYGPGRLGLERLAAGATVIRAADAGPGNRIHVDDLVSCCLAAMRPDLPAGLYNVGDGDSRSSGEFSAAVAKLAGLPAPAEISLSEARRTWSPARLSFVTESRQLDLTRMTEMLGVRPRYANAENGIRASLDEEAAG